jgi:hypothetical protein
MRWLLVAAVAVFILLAGCPGPQPTGEGNEFSYDVVIKYNEGSVIGKTQFGDKPLMGRCS